MIIALRKMVAVTDMQGNTLKKAIMRKHQLIYTAIEHLARYNQGSLDIMQFICKFVNISLSAVYILSFFTDQPTHFYKREGARKRNILLGDD